jgi:hypothetical protein
MRAEETAGSSTALGMTALVDWRGLKAAAELPHYKEGAAQRAYRISEHEKR